MTAFRLSDIVVMESFAAFPLFSVVKDVIPSGAKIIRFDDAGAVVTADGTVARLEFPVPHRAGMTELVVERATAKVAGRRIDSAPVTRPQTAASATVDLDGRPGGLRQVDLRALAVPGPGDDVVLEATSGLPGRYRWHEGDDGVERSTSGDGDALHLMVRAHDGSAFGPPATAVPAYAMPDNNAELYGPVLAGSTLRLDTPVAGAARVTFAPPVNARKVQLFLGVNRDDTTLAHEAQPMGWTASEVSAIWASAPTEVTLRATAGGPEPVTVADLPGELGTRPIDVDFTPAARALLGEAYGASTGDDLLLAVEAQSETAGDLVASSLQLAAHYRLDAVAAVGMPVVLRGSPATIAVPIADGLEPEQLVLTVDGSFGPGARVAASDHDLPGRRSGLRLAGAAQVARRVTLTTEERTRPLLRISLYGRSDDPCELVLSLAADRNGRLGPAIGETVALQVAPQRDPAWHRCDLPVPAAPPGASEAVWVLAQVSTGRFWWLADPGPGDAATATVSSDGGATWTSTEARPVVQLHYMTARPEPAPLRLLGPTGLLATDVLALTAARSRVETTRLDAQLRELAGGPIDLGTVASGAIGSAVIAGAATATAVATEATSVSFRKEAVQPMADLAALAAVGDTLDLTFVSDRDADFRVLDVVLRYDPWKPA